MNCRNCEQSLSAYLDNELGGEQMLRLRQHLADCEYCREELEALRDLKMLLAQVPTIEPRAGFEERLLQTVFSEEPAKTRRLPWVAAISVAAACGAVMVATQFRTNQTAPTQVASTNLTPLEEDQALAAAGDPLSGQPPMVTTVSYGDR